MDPNNSNSNSNIIFFFCFLCVVPQSLFSGLVDASPCGLPLEWPLLCILVCSVKVVVLLCFKFTTAAPSSVIRKIFNVTLIICSKLVKMLKFSKTRNANGS